MTSRSTRTLVDVALLAAIAWMWISIYESFTRSGLWPVLSRGVGGATTLHSELAVLAFCVLVGWFPIATVSWLVWRLALRGKLDPDFPAARLRRRHG